MDWRKVDIFDLSSQKGRLRCRTFRSFSQFETDVVSSETDSEGHIRSVSFLDQEGGQFIFPGVRPSEKGRYSKNKGKNTKRKRRHRLQEQDKESVEENVDRKPLPIQ